jgi:hypothetical protein
VKKKLNELKMKYRFIANDKKFKIEKEIIDSVSAALNGNLFNTY